MMMFIFPSILTLKGLFDYIPLIKEFVLMSGGTNVIFMPNHSIIKKWIFISMCNAQHPGVNGNFSLTQNFDDTYRY